ncbi:glyoxalase/bleomycin resistance/extradiol dioxygenase family protein [Saccharopolyspora rhizosphaerae]|uniref:Glyoxalase/bleomycin resistance/extradiol dioxygenase family protein n=1 Tax=Saccharopolyspora rhizosphaerae TaxID=2492662 RepID=A0A3R8P8K5_9PSEU|nr:VOC family protein [Saccharopolyspora rhizosphaerae]RRO18741.1 glyoxalase/bleomycin resistance/extradiol dioxygenase family protein [Saccharopolyspora rhizosphaerae]
MAMQTYLNLPVEDLNRSVEFFTALGFSFDQNFTDQNATCMVISGDAYVMLLVKPFFKSFTPKDVADATKVTEVITALSADSREQVDELVEKARQAGSPRIGDVVEEGPMYSRSFEDPDGHIWEVVHMPVD